MNIDINQNIKFKSRNPVIKNADNIARYVNQLYPRVSGTKMYSLGKYRTFCDYYVRNGVSPFDEYHKKIGILRSLEKKLYKGKRSNLYKCVSYLDAIKKEKVGNCGESAFIARTVAACNGIKNTKVVYLESRGEVLDHAVVYVNDKKPYIIDSWLGFADYVPNTLEKYSKEYSRLIGINSKINKSTLYFSEPEGNYVTNDKMRLSEELVKNLVKKCPEIVMPSFRK